MKARFEKYILHFKRPSGTSRGVLYNKETYFLHLEKDGKRGIGECGLFRGLSADDTPDYEDVLGRVCHRINSAEEVLPDDPALEKYPSIRFGLEAARLSLDAGQGGPMESAFTRGQAGIPINGLIWMGSREYMSQQIEEKLKAGFRCIKIKIGALDFEEELSVIGHLRRNYSPKELEIRVDANGAFTPKEAPEKLERLAELSLHSIEQPIRAGQIEQMARLCENSPLPIALDEELIGVFGAGTEELIRTVKPHYIILKPSLLGGMKAGERWISLAEKYGCGWWVTSALESNIGLEAIARWTFLLNSPIPQGLGTGSLYTNNVPSPLSVRGAALWYGEGPTSGKHRAC